LQREQAEKDDSSGFVLKPRFSSHSLFVAFLLNAVFAAYQAMDFFARVELRGKGI
jgi:hypothetical protein